MKKYIILLLVSILAFTNSNADIYTSVSKKIEIKKETKDRVPLKLHWYGKAGINVGVTKGDSSPSLREATSSIIGLDLNPGFYCFFRPSNPSEFYWGVDINLGVNLVHLNEGMGFWGDNTYWKNQNVFMPYANIAPQLGWRKNLSHALDLDIHLEPAGLYVTTDSNVKMEGDGGYWEPSLFQEHIDGYSKIGIGLWHHNLNFDISFRQPWLWFPATVTLGVGIQF